MKTSFRCSELDRVLACHASRLLALKVGDRYDRGDGARTEGNWCHYTAAKILVDEESATIGDGGLIPPTLGDWKPSGFSSWIVDYFVSAVRAETPGMALIVEDEMIAGFKEFTLTGHADVLAFSADGKEAIGFDLKAGAIPVQAAEENNQMLGYMVLVALCYPTVEKVRWLIVQPKNDEEAGFDRITEVSISGDEIKAMAEYLDRALTRVLFNPYFINSDDGGKQCKYCPAALKCPAIRNDIAIMKTTLTSQAIDEITPEMDIEELMIFDDARRKFDGPFKAAHEILKEKIKADPNEQVTLEDGRTLGITRRGGKRTWKQGHRVTVLSKVDGEGFDPETRAEVVEVKIGELEKAIAKHRGIPINSKKKECAKDIVGGEYGQFWDQSEVEMVVVR
jgi:hypothetical protein